ncbi:ABC transporter ATP-binding protein [Nonomuraea sp. MG754425]|uniref:ABC transporter ATP-binding protein n=1 Tax=Nonomuraea sp. MG754425 TaxID=2570319 RepID=UPI001F1AF04C|nr:ABC transporter ATP-binding protein [Nonomuraea sp. MG754425]
MPVTIANGVSVILGEVSVLDGVDLSVEQGEIVALTGENGAGKSTLMRCLAGLQRVSAGEVLVFGRPPAGDEAFWRAVALVTEDHAWYPWLTVREHLELSTTIHGVRLEPDAVLDSFELLDRADAAPLTLSTGQRQRLALGCALARPSRLLLLDEPESGLDPAARGRLAELLADYAHEGTLIMATHDLELASATGARVVTLSAGART